MIHHAVTIEALRILRICIVLILDDLPNTGMTPAGKSVPLVSRGLSQKTSRTGFEIQGKYDNNRKLCQVVP